MSMKTIFLGAAATSLALVGTAAQAASYDVNLAGWQTYGEFGNPGNSELFINLGAGSKITGFDYLDLTFATEHGSFQSELVLSVNDENASFYMDWQPSLVNNGSPFGPASGYWGGPTGQAPDGVPYAEGAPFTAYNGIVWVTVYELFDDPENSGEAPNLLDASISAGTLRVFYQPVPEPGTYGMMALGLLAIGGAALRRRRD